jgi:hypothetical protein
MIRMLKRLAMKKKVRKLRVEKLKKLISQI